MVERRKTGYKEWAYRRNASEESDLIGREKGSRISHQAPRISLSSWAIARLYTNEPILCSIRKRTETSEMERIETRSLTQLVYSLGSAT